MNTLNRSTGNTNSILKKVKHIYEHGSAHWVGDGFPVRNLIPSSGLDKGIDPFLMLDYAGPAEFPASNKPRGVGEHPHRGFETVTIAYQGSVEHRDSAGNSGTINPGDVQWMTAGSGVVHEEMHEREFARKGGTFEMIQLWVNLPRVHKMTPPRYQTITSEDIPRLDLGGNSYLRVIAGELDTLKGPAQTFTSLHLFDLNLDVSRQKLTSASDGTIILRIPAGHNSAVFLLKGKVRINEQLVEGESKLALLDTIGDTVSFFAETESRLLIFGGEAIAEPVASYGPFVMNTQEELAQAMIDYREGRMGHLSSKS